MEKYAYIELTFPTETKQYFQELVAKLVPKDKFYYSSDMPHIKGDVTETLHCTLFFGINPNLVNDQGLINIVKNADFKEIILGKVVLIEGYQGLYKILLIEVLDEDNKFSKFAKQVEEFINDKDIHYEAKPHLTLAYATPDFQINNCSTEIVKKLEGKGVQISILKNYEK